MTTYIALFRGINVGGRHILPMDELAALLESMGCDHVKTYIQSGNAVFEKAMDEPADFAEEIGLSIQKEYGFKPRVLLLDKSQLEKAIQANPFPVDQGKGLHFLFLETRPAKPDWLLLNDLKSQTERFELIDTVFYLYAPDGIGRSRLAAKVEHGLGVSATGRNWNTVNKLYAMVQ